MQQRSLNRPPNSGHQAILPLPVAPLDIVNVQWMRHVPAMVVVSSFGGLWGALFNRSRTVVWRSTPRNSTPPPCRRVDEPHHAYPVYK